MYQQMDCRGDTKNILKPIDMNVKNDYPPCKRMRLSEIDKKRQSDMWSLHQKNLLLDEVFDNGIEQLEWDSDTSPVDQKIWCPDSVDVPYSPITQEDFEKQLALLEPAVNLSPPSSIERSSNCDSSATIKSPIRPTDYFELLSDEMILQILHWLPKCFLPNIALVCKRFYQLSQDKSLWERMDVSGRNLEPGVLGHILSRQVIILRMAQTKIAQPAILDGVKANAPEFKARLLYLDLSMASISKQSLTELFLKCDRLKKVSLELVPVDAEVMCALSQNKNIEVLNLTMVEGLDETGFQYLLNSCRKIRELNISWTYLTRSCIRYVCLNLPPSIDRLNFSGCQKYMSDSYVGDLVSVCPNLRELDLSDCTGLTGQSVEYISLLEDLNFLALSRCYFIPCRSLMGLSKLSSLAYLDLHGGFLDSEELKMIQTALGGRVHLNKFKFSSVARPTVGPRRSSIWGLRVRD